MGGIVGRLFREFAVTLSIAIAVSAVVSLTLTPMMCARLLASAKGRRGRLYTWSEGIFEAVLGAYDRGLRWVIRHQMVMAFVTFLTFVLTVVLFIIVPKGLFPQQDTGQLMGTSDAPQDVSFPSMKERQMALNKVVAADPDVDHFISVHRLGGDDEQAAPSSSAQAEAAPQGDRRRHHQPASPEAREGRGVNLFLQSIQDVRVGGRHRADAVPVHARRTRTSTSSSLGAADGRASAEDARAHGRQHRPADERPRARRQRRPRHGVAPRRHAAGRRRHALRRVRPAVRRDLASPRSTRTTSSSK